MKGVNSAAWEAALVSLRVLRECHGPECVIALLQQELSSELTAKRIAEERQRQASPPKAREETLADRMQALWRT